MPKAPSSLPVSALFGIAKPSGPTSMSILDTLKPLIASSRLFVEEKELKKEKGKTRKAKHTKYAVKIGQGGTLDPLADGVLVVGVGKATKKLGEFLDCVKEYRTTCLLGCETDTYDSQGAQVRVAPWRHVTREQVEEALKDFRGELMQTPPIFSALKMDGKPLYEYARKGIPLPRPIEKRKVTVHELELVEWIGSDHNYSYPEQRFTEEQKKAVESALRGAEQAVEVKDEPEQEASSSEAPAAFVLRMKVSGGTYVRSVVHDLGHALGSAAHVVTLTRTRQGRFVMKLMEKTDRECVPWDVVEEAAKDVGDKDDQGWTRWEREVLDKFEIAEDR
ncbi:pseudouridine synthase [Fomitopsis serialis]|uniref:pseudouridine synthase n=1 Tax=Fomitopsis serialis TaxID=139415 RepID=UPI002007E071|nr:pseudouridine synthase [Neoantrodia serialis]KAH9934707.1 pseudouridine synthase [Neoantrodia serialis]